MLKGHLGQPLLVALDLGVAPRQRVPLNGRNLLRRPRNRRASKPPAGLGLALGVARVLASLELLGVVAHGLASQSCGILGNTVAGGVPDGAAAVLGIVLVPDVVTRTPPFIDRVLPESAAARAGLRPDDLIVMVDAQVTTSCREAAELIARYEKHAPIRVSVLRDQMFLEFELAAESTSSNEVNEKESP